MRMDDSGEGWWVIACSVIGGIIGATAKIVSNVLTGQRWNDGVIGAAAGGAAAGATFALTGNSTAAAYAGAFAEAAVNEALSYIPKGNNKTSTKKATYKNISVSIKKIIQETLINGSLSVATGAIAEKAVYVNPKWVKPKKIKTSFVGNYSKKLTGQTTIQSIYGIGINISMDMETFLGIGKSQQNEIATLYPIMQVGPAR